MNMITLPYVKTPFKDFGILITKGGTYVCPGWHLVPYGTTREQIQFDKSLVVEAQIEKSIQEQTEWQVPGSRPGVVYQVNRYPDGDWTCSCPAKAFKRGDCKHIIALKS